MRRNPDDSRESSIRIIREKSLTQGADGIEKRQFPDCEGSVTLANRPACDSPADSDPLVAPHNATP